jgi:uncharacterized membrane protein
MLQSGETRTNSTTVSASLASLYATYGLILLTVPTFGVAAALGLLRLWKRPAPTDPIERSHFIFQRRTLMAAVASIILGGLLIIVGIGVFVIFIMAVWNIIRGATGLRSLLHGDPIRHPNRLFY